MKKVAFIYLEGLKKITTHRVDSCLEGDLAITRFNILKKVEKKIGKEDWREDMLGPGGSHGPGYPVSQYNWSVKILANICKSKMRSNPKR